MYEFRGGLPLSFKTIQVKNQSHLLAKVDTFQSLQAAQAEFPGMHFQSGSRLSFYADQIAGSVPEGIRLTKLSVFPETKKRTYQDGEVIPEFETGMIRIEGIADDSQIFNTWVSKLEILGIVEILDIGERDGLNRFRLELSLR